MQQKSSDIAKKKAINKLARNNTRFDFDYEIDKLKDKLLDVDLSHKSFNRIVKSIDLLQSANQISKSLHIGDQAPDFQLKNTIGKNIKLSDEIKKGKVILKFFRGGWCPYSYLGLRSLEKIANIITKDGSQIFAICPEDQANCIKTKERNHLNFDILSDKANIVSEDYKLINKNSNIENSVLDISLESAIDSGDISYHLPLPGVFIIDEWMTIRFAFHEADYKTQLDTNLLLDCLRHI